MNPPPEVVGAVVDAALDRLVAVGDGPVKGAGARALANILRRAENQPADEVAPRLARLDRLVATRLGREHGAPLVASRGILGPDQATALLNFLDARIADGEAEEGFQTALHGFCLVGPEGVPFLADLAQREQRLARSVFSSNLGSAMREMVLMGIDDAAIRQALRIALYNDTARVENPLAKARAVMEKTLARRKQRGDMPPWRTLCKK